MFGNFLEDLRIESRRISPDDSYGSLKTIWRILRFNYRLLLTVLPNRMCPWGHFWKQETVHAFYKRGFRYCRCLNCDNSGWVKTPTN